MCIRKMNMILTMMIRKMNIISTMLMLQLLWTIASAISALEEKEGKI